MLLGRLIFLVCALEILDLVIVKVPDARGHFIDQIVVMRHQEHRALIALQRDVERVDGFKIKVVGGFVQHQHVGLLQHELAEEDARRLAAGKHVSLLGGFIADKEHLPQQAANLFIRNRRVPLEDPVQNGAAFFNQAAMVLRKIADGGFVSPGGLAAVNEWAVIA